MSTAVIDFDTRPGTAAGRVPAPRRPEQTARRVPVSPTKSRSGLRLTRRGRFVVLLLTVEAAFGGFTVLSDPAVSTAEQNHPAAEKVIVEPGQSLWDIATQIAPGEDPRDVISEIVDMNSLESSGSIQAGQPLFIPSY
jgi:hypothetical protein